MMGSATNGGYRGLIRTSKPKNEVMREKMQGGIGRLKSLVDKKTMYRMRYELQFCGASIHHISLKYGLTKHYVSEKVFNYGTMSLVIPKESLHPDEYEG